MSEIITVWLATSNPSPLPSLGNKTPNLELIAKKEIAVSELAQATAETPSPPPVATLQALLRAEAAFLAKLRSETAKRCAVKSDTETIQRELNHENVIHVARFFFLLKALDCTTPEAVDALIDSHNARVKSLLDSQNFQFRSRSELEKSLFKDNQQYICVKTVRERRRAVFAKTEIAALLFDHMSRDSAVRTQDLLVRAGLLIEEDADPLKGTNRKLIKTDGFIENAVADYLRNIGDAMLQEPGVA